MPPLTNACSTAAESAADSMQLIGAHMIGEQAIELIDIGLVAMQMNATFQAFIDACFNFPSLAELYKYATYDAMKRKQQGRVAGRPRSD